MINSRCYWEVKKVNYVYCGKSYVKYDVTNVLEQEGLTHRIYWKSYTSRYGAINFCRRHNQKDGNDIEIVLIENKGE